MIPAGLRRIGWLAILALCAACYVFVHLRANALHAQVVRAERQIVQLEEENLLLETEFLTRSNHLQLAKLNRIYFGYRAPEAAQFLHGERQLARFSLPRSPDAPAPIRLARLGSGEDLPRFPQLDPQRDPQSDPQRDPQSDPGQRQPGQPRADARPAASGMAASGMAASGPRAPALAALAAVGPPQRPAAAPSQGALARVALPGIGRPLALTMASFARDGAP